MEDIKDKILIAVEELFKRMRESDYRKNAVISFLDNSMTLMYGPLVRVYMDEQGLWWEERVKVSYEKEPREDLNMRIMCTGGH